MTMYEIYDHDAPGYDRLVAAEDYEGRLCPALREFTGIWWLQT